MIVIDKHRRQFCNNSKDDNRGFPAERRAGILKKKLLDKAVAALPEEALVRQNKFEDLPQSPR
jgi:hypothetical protein